MSSSMPDKDHLRHTILRLLEKANRHPDLTPRMLRVKTEQKLKLKPGVLNPKKAFVKRVALTWWSSDAPAVKKEEAGDELTLKRLMKVANVAGKAPAILKGLSELSDEEKISVLRERLRESGLEFSDTPTTEEIESIQKKRDDEKSMEGIDSSAIVEGTRKRAVAASEEPKQPKRSKIVVSDNEEEADL